MKGAPHQYIPDFIVRVDDGRDEPVNVVVEIKGQRGEDARIKAETMRGAWVPGVNALGDFGRWAFAELRDVHTMERDFGNFVADLARSPGPDFKELLATAPLDGIDLTRPLDTGRRADL